MDFHNDGNFMSFFIHQRIRKTRGKQDAFKYRKFCELSSKLSPIFISQQVKLIKKISAKVPFSFHLISL
jgi:hypothetical protein